MSSLLDNLVIFGRVLRTAGVDVPPDRLHDAVRALALVGLSSREDVYCTCRALLVRNPDQFPVFDAAFGAFWREHHGRSDRASVSRRESPLATPAPQASASLARAAADDSGGTSAGENPQQGDEPGALPVWSEHSGLASRDIADFSEQEMAEARAALARLVWTPGERRTRRWVAGHERGIDFRRSLRASLATGGDIVRLAHRQRRWRPRPLVLLCDVSRSMAPYSRALLQFAQALTARHHRVEAFLFATALTRITRQLRAAHPASALSDIVRRVPDWSGGTRIGAAVRQFHLRWARRVASGGAVVLLISDGWDLGDPGELRDQIARLQRRCHRLVWLNPLIGTADYAPLTRGLVAALPFVDDFLPARTLRNLADLALHLNALGERTGPWNSPARTASKRRPNASGAY